MPSTNEIEARIGGALINIEFAKIHLLQVMKNNGCPGFPRSKEITEDITQLLITQSHIQALKYNADTLLKMFIEWRDSVKLNEDAEEELRRANVGRPTT